MGDTKTAPNFRTVGRGAYAIQKQVKEAERLWNKDESGKCEAGNLILQIVQDCDTLLEQAIQLRDAVSV